MKETVALLACCLLYVACLSQQILQLAPPLMKYPSVFFTKAVVVELSFREPGAVIRYTLDNTEPNEKSRRYTKPVIITNNRVTLKARSFSKKYLPSATIAGTFMQAGIAVTSVTCTKPDEKYPGAGSQALIDNKGGNPSGSAKTWLGFQDDTVTVELALQKAAPVKETVIEFLHAEGGWIFMPQKIGVYAFDETTKTWQAFSQKEFSFDAPVPGSNCAYISLRGTPVKTAKLLVKIMPLQKLPDWHDGKGQHAWIFIDEIKLY